MAAASEHPELFVFNSLVALWTPFGTGVHVRIGSIHIDNRNLLTSATMVINDASGTLLWSKFLSGWSNLKMPEVILDNGLQFESVVSGADVTVTIVYFKDTP